MTIRALACPLSIQWAPTDIGTERPPRSWSESYPVGRCSHRTRSHLLGHYRSLHAVFTKKNIPYVFL